MGLAELSSNSLDIFVAVRHGSMRNAGCIRQHTRRIVRLLAREHEYGSFSRVQCSAELCNVLARDAMPQVCGCARYPKARRRRDKNQRRVQQPNQTANNSPGYPAILRCRFEDIDDFGLARFASLNQGDCIGALTLDLGSTTGKRFVVLFGSMAIVVAADDDDRVRHADLRTT